MLSSAFSLLGCTDEASIEKIAKTRRVETPQIASYISKWHPLSEHEVKDGVYTSSFSINDTLLTGTVNRTYVFNQGSLTYTAHMSGHTFFVLPFSYSFSGKATYKVSDGLITYSDPVGDVGEFPLYPTPIEVVNGGRDFILHELNDDGSVDLVLYTKPE